MGRDRNASFSSFKPPYLMVGVKIEVQNRHEVSAQQRYDGDRMAVGGNL
jgi:hypothetical protein